MFKAGTICLIAKKIHEGKSNNHFENEVVELDPAGAEGQSGVLVMDWQDLRTIRERDEFDEWFKEIKVIVIELPEKIKKALQAWLDAQKYTPLELTYREWRNSIEFYDTHNDYNDMDIEIKTDNIDVLEDGREYTLEELGLEV